jgi:pantetheine-phosphate adenylyltransferase
MKAIITGSFDPFTKGHQWMVREASKLFKKVVILVGNNPTKTYAYSFNERKAIIIKCLPDLKVEVLDISNRLLVDVCHEINADYIVRGIRNSGDVAHESTVNAINQQLDPTIKTMFLMPPKELENVSSSMVKHLSQFEDNYAILYDYLPEEFYHEYMNDINSQFLWDVFKRVNYKGNYPEFQELIRQQQGGITRFYHTLTHLRHLIGELQKVKSELTMSQYNTILTAILYHDCCYDGLGDIDVDNSKKQVNPFLIRSTSIEDVNNLIDITKYKRKPLTKAEKYMHDIDISILGQTPPRYEFYTKMVRKEYANVSDAVFNKGRIKILKTLSKGDIFTTPIFKKKYEEAAKRNIKMELDRLDS